jgi:AAA15 family ATPase/GTPase
MKQKIKINNFGPVKHFESEEKNFTVLFGPQASGKSTISKCIYFFKSIRDEIYEMAIETIENQRRHLSLNFILKRIGNRMIHLFGPQIRHDPFEISYEYKRNIFISIINKMGDGEIVILFSPELKVELDRIINFVREYKFRKKSENRGSFKRLLGVIGDRTFLINLRKQLIDIFNEDREVLYIPAGRSLIAALSNKLNLLFKLTEQDWNVDYLTKVFSEKILDTREYFDRNLHEIIVDRQVNKSLINQANEIITTILGGTYLFEEGKDKLYYDNDKFLSLNHASSGQQESIWILYLILYYLIEDKKCFIIIEEPEAHLFPTAQNEIIKIISLLVNRNDNQCIVTTHSPYILSSLNNLLYGFYLANEHGQLDYVEKMFSRDILVNPDNLNALFITKECVVSIYDNESKLLSGSLLDEVSEINNGYYNRLFTKEMEIKYGDVELNDFDM